MDDGGGPVERRGLRGKTLATLLIAVIIALGATTYYFAFFPRTDVPEVYRLRTQ